MECSITNQECGKFEGIDVDSMRTKKSKMSVDGSSCQFMAVTFLLDDKLKKVGKDINH